MKGCAVALLVVGFCVLMAWPNFAAEQRCRDAVARLQPIAEQVRAAQARERAAGRPYATAAALGFPDAGVDVALHDGGWRGAVDDGRVRVTMDAAGVVTPTCATD